MRVRISCRNQHIYQPFFTILSHFNTVHILTIYLFKIHTNFIISSPSYTSKCENFPANFYKTSCFPHLSFILNLLYYSCKRLKTSYIMYIITLYIKSPNVSIHKSYICYIQNINWILKERR